VLPLELVVQGDPVPKGRPRVYGRGAVTPARTRKAEAELGWELKAKYPGLQPDAETLYRVEAYFACRASLPEQQWPDGDNLLKLVLDAFTAIVWADDRQVRRFEVGVDYDAAEAYTRIHVSRFGGELAART
jgi:Holliday junction resolvase RusA-like endonuclease